MICILVIGIAAGGLYLYYQRKFAGSFSPRFQYTNPTYNLESMANLETKSAEKRMSSSSTLPLKAQESKDSGMQSESMHDCQEFFNPMEEYQHIDSTCPLHEP